MMLPKRIDTHIKESDSWKILKNHIPAKWIIREVSERDYGIDCYIELVNNDNEVAGDLLSGQLKGTERIEWRVKDKKNKEATFSGIKMETINYWMNLPVPVFLLVADLEESNLYFAPVKQQVRSQYSKYLKQKKMSFSLVNNFNFGADRGLVLFLVHYFREKFHDKFISALRTILVHRQHYLEFIQGMQQLDCFMGAETDEELLFIHIYQTCHTLSQLLAIDWGIDSLVNIIKKDQETWKDSYYMFHYQTFTDVLPAIEVIFFQIIEKAHNRITKTEKEYWSKTEPILYRMMINLEHLKPG